MSPERGQHGGEPGRVSDGAEGGNGRLAATGVAVPRRGRRQRGHGGPVPPLGQEPGSADHDQRVGIFEGAGHGGGAGSSASRGPGRPVPPRRRGGAPRAGPPAERGGDVGGRQPTEARQRTERGRLHAGVGITESTPGQGRVAAVAGQGDAAPALLGAAVGGRIRGNIVPHLSEYVRP